MAKRADDPQEPGIPDRPGVNIKVLGSCVDIIIGVIQKIGKRVIMLEQEKLCDYQGDSGPHSSFMFLKYILPEGFRNRYLCRRNNSFLTLFFFVVFLFCINGP